MQIISELKTPFGDFYLEVGYKNDLLPDEAAYRVRRYRAGEESKLFYFSFNGGEALDVFELIKSQY